MYTERYSNDNEINEAIKEAAKESELESMSHNMNSAVIQELIKLGETELARKIKDQEISLELEKKKFVEMGEISKKSNPDFNVENYSAMRVQKIVEELRSKKLN